MSARPSGACTVVALFLSVFVVASIDAGSSDRRLILESRNAKGRELGEDTCVSLLRPHIQKVSLMFLVRGDVYHEAAWTQWLGDVAGMVPSSVACSEELSKCYKAMLERKSPPGSVYDEQSYYSIVVHPKPEFPGYSNGSIFNGRIVEQRLETQWGGYSLVAATRVLMKAALEDPFAQRFQLVCEATIPLRAPLFTHNQLISMNMSRVGWNGQMFRVESAGYRWPLAMHEEWPELHKYTKFHRQFVTLIREHAQLVMNDTFLSDLFERHCYTPVERHKAWCVSDEQYIGTLLSWKLEDQVQYGYTDDMALALLKGGSGIPVEDIDADFLLQARGATANISRLYGFQDHHGECHAVEKPVGEHVWFENYPRHVCTNIMRQPPPYNLSKAFPRCFFFARKFNAHTTIVVQKMLESLYIT